MAHWARQHSECEGKKVRKVSPSNKTNKQQQNREKSGPLEKLFLNESLKALRNFPGIQ